jgi:hypothetical protein
MLISDAISADFQKELETTVKVLEALPADKLGWQPHVKSMTLGQLACHIAESPKWCQSMLEDEFDFASAGDWKPFESNDPGEIVAALRQNGKGLTEAIAGRDDAFMQATWRMKSGDKVLMEAPPCATSP